MAISPSFLSSKAVQGYSPQFLDTGVEASAPMASAQSPDLTNRLLQIMGGNLSGTLSGGEKLSALGALLKSVSRGSQASPQDVVRNIQQQKLQEVQGRLQIEQFRKQAERQAQLGALKAEYVANAPSPQAARELQLMNDEDFSAFLRERNKPTSQNLDGIRAQLADLYGFGTPEYNQALKSYIERLQTISGPGGSVFTQQPVSLPALPGTAPKGVTPSNREKALAELKKRGAI
jgi:hypothetical protein